MKLGLVKLQDRLGPDQKWFSVDVEAGTPAARAGVQRGDIIMTMNFVSPLEWGQDGRIVPPTGLPLEIQRDGVRIVLVLEHPSVAAPAQPPSELASTPLPDGLIETWRAQIRADDRIKDEKLLRFFMFIAERLHNKPGHPWHFTAIVGVGEIAVQLGCRKEKVLDLYKQAEELGHLRVRRGTGKGNPNRYEPVLWPGDEPPPQGDAGVPVAPADLGEDTSDPAAAVAVVAAADVPPALPPGYYVEGSEQWTAWRIYFWCCSHDGIPAEMIAGAAPKRALTVDTEWPPVGRGVSADQTKWWEVYQGSDEFRAWLERLREWPNIEIHARESLRHPGIACLFVPSTIPPPRSPDDQSAAAQRPEKPVGILSSGAAHSAPAVPVGPPSGATKPGVSPFERESEETRDAMVAFFCNKYRLPEDRALAELRTASREELERLFIAMKMRPPRFEADYHPMYDSGPEN
jgi:hypothetical protein